MTKNIKKFFWKFFDFVRMNESVGNNSTKNFSRKFLEFESINADVGVFPKHPPLIFE